MREVVARTKKTRVILFILPGGYQRLDYHSLPASPESLSQGWFGLSKLACTNKVLA